MPALQTPPTRDRLLEAATIEFAAHGAQGARVQTICKRAKVNERMLYEHFGDKRGLYEAVLRAQWLALAKNWTLEIDETLSPYEGLCRAFGELARALRTNPLFVRLSVHEALTGWRHAPRATLDAIPAPIRRIHARGVKSGAFRRDVTFETIYFAVVGAVGWQTIFGGRFADVKRARARDRELVEKQVAATIALILRGAQP